MGSIRNSFVGAVGVALIAANACSGDQQNLPASSATDSGTGTNSANGGSNAGGDIGFSNGSGGGNGGAEPCVQEEAEATLINRPVDIIFVIDNSGSMSNEIEDVEEQITLNFASILDDAEPPIDYRVIMVSEFGDFDDKAICVAEPLGGIEDNDTDGHCDDIPDEPINGPKFFHHAPNNDDPGVDSHNALCQLGHYFDKADRFGLQPNGYQQVLRDDAFKFFVVVTDDRPDNENKDCTFGTYDDDNDPDEALVMADSWDADMLALSPTHFGSASERNYTFHSIISLEPYLADAQNEYGFPHPPDASLAPITPEECQPSAQNPGVGYQALSIKTGGARFPTCGLDYTLMFELMALGVIEGAAVACEFVIPDPPVGEELELDTVVVEYTANGNTVELQQVDKDNCTANGFYFEDDLIKLCPEVCAIVQADEDANVGIKFGCKLDPD